LSVISASHRMRAVIGLCIAIVLSGLFASQMPSVRNRMTTSLGVQTRKDLWEANYEMFKDRPLTGVGLKHNQELSGYYLMDKYHSTDVFSGHAHDNVLDLLGGTGLIGLAAAVFWFALIFIWVIHPSVRVDRYFIGRGLFCALVVFQLNGLTQVNFWDAKVQHQLMFAVGWILWGAVTA
jgi:O-antigen ligase